jgi:hypothetical protein
VQLLLFLQKKLTFSLPYALLFLTDMICGSSVYLVHAPDLVYYKMLRRRSLCLSPGGNTTMAFIY